MQASVVVALALGAPIGVTLARANVAKPLVVWNSRIVDARPPATSRLSTVSHTLYLDDCLPNGCTVTPGNDDARTNRSSIVSGPSTLDAWSWGDQR